MSSEEIAPVCVEPSEMDHEDLSQHPWDPFATEYYDFTVGILQRSLVQVVAAVPSPPQVVVMVEAVMAVMVVMVVVVDFTKTGRGRHPTQVLVHHLPARSPSTIEFVECARKTNPFEPLPLPRMIMMYINFFFLLSFVHSVSGCGAWSVQSCMCVVLIQHGLLVPFE
jgi:hypothetical protein